MESPGDDQIVQSITESPLFRKAPAARELLLFLWKQRDTPLTEYGIGVDALGRQPEFDPKTDATVRVQVSRLRQRRCTWSCPCRCFFDGATNRWWRGTSG